MKEREMKTSSSLIEPDKRRRCKSQLPGGCDSKEKHSGQQIERSREKHISREKVGEQPNWRWKKTSAQKLALSMFKFGAELWPLDSHRKDPVTGTPTNTNNGVCIYCWVAQDPAGDTVFVWSSGDSVAICAASLSAASSCTFGMAICYSGPTGTISFDQK